MPLWYLLDRDGIDLNLPNQLNLDTARWSALAQSSDDTRRRMQVCPALAMLGSQGVLAYRETVRQMEGGAP